MGRLFDDDVVIKMRGLPWSATVDEIISFLDGVNIKNGRAGVHITTTNGGKPSGEAFVEVEDLEDLENALQKDKEHLGSRYIEVFKAKRLEMEWALKRDGEVYQSAVDKGCLKLRGLPYSCTKHDIVEFFDGLEIIPNGITLIEDNFGKSTGEAFVQFVDVSNAERALLKHKEKIGHRYIEIFKSSLDELRSATSNYVDKMRPFMGQGFGRPSPYDRGDRFGGGGSRFGGGGMRGPGPRGGGMRGLDDRFDDGPSPWGGFGNSDFGGNSGRWNGPSETFIVHMRGLPFKATQADIADFFRPVVPVDILIEYNNSGRPSGEANVEFSCEEDARQAMTKDKSNMDHRYIELFLRPGGRGMGRPGPNSNGFGSGFGGPPSGRFRNDDAPFERRNNAFGGGGKFRNNSRKFDFY